MADEREFVNPHNLNLVSSAVNPPEWAEQNMPGFFVAAQSLAAHFASPPRPFSSTLHTLLHSGNARIASSIY